MTEISFGPFCFDMAAGKLLRDKVEVRLRPQVRQVLRVLLLHQGRSVSHDQMIAEAWQGTFVSRHTVDVTVGEVKKSLGEYGRWIVHRPKMGYSLEVPTSDELVRKGWHFWYRRTPEGAQRAIECFEQAAAECPGDFRAFDGLSTCYLGLATFGMRAPREVYRDFLAAHERAVALGGLTPDLRCNRAHGLHMFEHRLPEAEEEFRQTLREKPAFATAHVRMSLMYATLERLDQALEILRLGYQADPLLPTLPAAEVNVRVWLRQYDEAIAIGTKAVELHPYLQIVRANFAQALQCAGHLEDALAEYRLASVMCPDLPWLRAIEGTCLASLGRRREARAILEELEDMRASRYVDAYYMAVFRHALGQQAAAFGELDRARDENSAFLYSMSVDPKADAFRGDRRFTRLREHVRTPV